MRQTEGAAVRRPPTASELEARAALGGPVVGLREVADELEGISYGQLRGWVDRSADGALPGGIRVFQPGPQRARYILRADVALLKGLLDD